jgi:hypothetical protein
MRRPIILVALVYSLAAILVGPAASRSDGGSGTIIIQPCLNLRGDATGASSLLGCVPYKTVISIDCVKTGTAVTGAYGTSTLWDHTTYSGRGGFVADAWVYTGKSGAVAPACPAAPTTPTPAPTTPVAGSGPKIASGWTAQVRDTPSTSAAVITTLAAGRSVTMLCWTDAGTASYRYTSQRWFKVRADLGQTGYVHSSLVDQQAATPACIGLPFAQGETWTTSGTHSWNGTLAPARGSIDFSGGSGVVRAAGPGAVHFVPCSAGSKGSVLAIDHGVGRWSTYYHIKVDAGITEGHQVSLGQRLGTIGNLTPCGGESIGAHVHFTRWQLPASTSAAGLTVAAMMPYEQTLNGVDIGGWVVSDQVSRAYYSSYTNVQTGAVQQSLKTFANLTNSGRLG